MEENEWIVYLVRCADASLYCGITNDIDRRLLEHNAGRGAKYTRSRTPVEIVAVGPVMTKSAALQLECRIKRSPADEKIAALTKARE